MTSVADTLRRLAKEAAVDAQRAVEVAQVVDAGRELSQGALIALRRRARVNAETDTAFKKLEEARKAAITDPAVRHSVLTQEIKLLHGQEYPSIEKFFDLMNEVTASTLVSGQPAMPILVSVRREEADRWNSRLAIPIAFYNEKGNIVQRGVDWLIPATHDDTEAAIYLREIREKCYDTLIADVMQETLPDIRAALLYGIYFVGLGAVAFSDVFDEHFAPIEEGSPLMKRKPQEGRKADRRTYEVFRWGKSVFYAPQNEKSTAFVNALEVANQRFEDFWSGKTDAYLEMSKIIHQYEDEVGPLISPKHFLDGMSGLAAVCHHTWLGKNKPAFVLLEREPGSDRWRWVYANKHAVVALFGGRRLDFRKMSSAPLPSELQALLRKGEQLLPIDLPEEAGDAGDAAEGTTQDEMSAVGE